MHALTSTGCQLLTGQNSRDKIQELVPEWSQPCSSALALRGAGERKDSSLGQSLSGTCFWLRVAETTVSLVTQMSLLSIRTAPCLQQIRRNTQSFTSIRIHIMHFKHGHACTHTHVCKDTHTHTHAHTYTHIQSKKPHQDTDRHRSDSPL